MTDHQDGNVQTFCYRAAAICLDLSNQPSHCRSLKAIPQNFAIAKHYQTALPSQYLYTLQKLRRAPCLNIMCSQAFGSTVTFANTLIWLRKPCLVSRWNGLHLNMKIALASLSLTRKLLYYTRLYHYDKNMIFPSFFFLES